MVFIKGNYCSASRSAVNQDTVVGENVIDSTRNETVSILNQIVKLGMSILGVAGYA